MYNNAIILYRTAALGGRMRGTMENNNQKCPLCSTNLKLINGRMTCPTCGYYIQSEQTNTQNPGYPNIPPQNTQTFQSTPPKPKSNNWVLPLIISGAAVVIAIVAVIFFVQGNLLGNLNQNSQAQNNASTDRRGGQQASSSDSAAQTTPTTEPRSQRRLPESDFFIQFSEAIWEVGYRSISAEQYASLIALGIDQDDQSIYYQLDGDEPQYLSYLIDTYIDWSDLASFPGLEWISIDDDLSRGDLDGLDNLWAVYAENTISEYAKIIPHPEYIEELGTESTFFEESLEGIENFPNLLYLSVEYDQLEDISAILDFPNLLGLELYGCDNLMDYSPLMTLTQLDTLAIESSNLKTIDFVKVMPNLTYLSIEDSKITNLDALASCPNLTDLYLVDNYSVTDYSIVGELDQLTTLSLATSSNRDIVLPSLKNLTQLQTLALENISDLSLLRDAVNVTYLSLEECVAWNLDAITSMQMLNTVAIHDFASMTESLTPLTQLPALESLDLSETYVFGDITEIFSIPNLYYLNLSDCRVGIDFDNLPDNDMLEYLCLDGVTILKGPDYNNGSYDSINAHCDMFEHFPNLIELYAQNLKLDNIDFVENLPYLRYLDITNNNVTSLKPLESLSDFRAVWCGKNTILENVSESSKITVITSNF